MQCCLSCEENVKADCFKSELTNLTLYIVISMRRIGRLCKRWIDSVRERERR